MKVIAINGSPHPQGNTFHALKNIGEELKKENIEFEILQVGARIFTGAWDAICVSGTKTRNA